MMYLNEIKNWLEWRELREFNGFIISKEDRELVNEVFSLLKQIKAVNDQYSIYLIAERGNFEDVFDEDNMEDELYWNDCKTVDELKA